MLIYSRQYDAAIIYISINSSGRENTMKTFRGHFIMWGLGLLLLLSASIPAQDDGYSSDPLWTYDSDLMIGHVKTADLNGDGTPDIIAAEYNPDYYGYPSRIITIDGETGSFLWTYALQDGVRAMAIADLNNDGVIDVLAGASYESSPTPDGTLHAIDGQHGTMLWTYNLGETITDIVVANLNGDVYPDAVISSFDDYIRAFNGQTGTQLWQHYLGSLWINAVSSGDVNSDGTDDIAFAHEYLTNYDNYCGVLDGTDGTPIWEITVAYNVREVILADIDDDGNLEAVFAGELDDDHVHIYSRNALDGTLEWEYDLGYMGIYNTTVRFYAEDINNDSNLELIVANKYGIFNVFAFDGSSASPLWISEELDGYPRKLAFADVNDDKDVDIVIANGDRMQVISGQTGLKMWSYGIAGTAEDVACADLNGDEINEILVGGSANATGSPPNPTIGVWALQTIQSPLLWEHNFGEYGNAIASIDLNNDSCADVISVCSVDDLARAIDGRTGTELWSWTGTENVYAVTAGDFDGDGQADVAVAGNDDAVTAINGFDGSTLWQFTMPGDQIYRNCLAAADLNDDSFIDVIAGADDNFVYAIQGQNGSMLWAIDVGGEVEDVELFQMNGTGPLDIIVGTSGGPSGDRVVVLDGFNGSTLWYYQAPASIASVEIGDVDDDGLPDVFAGQAPYSTQVIVIDGATHTMRWTKSVSIASNTYGIGCGDLNDDKITDVLVPGTYSDSYVIALDGFDGAELWRYDVGDEVNCVIVADVNLDEFGDAIVACDDQTVYMIDGLTGELIWSYGTTGDVMHLLVDDISGNGLPNIACVTFGSEGIVYAFRTLAEGPFYVCGDANGDENINIGDAVFLITYIFKSGPAPDPIEAGDANGDTSVNIGDAVYLVNHIFNGGPAPVCP